MACVKIVLGIDPGTRVTGYGALKVEGSRIEPIDHGVICVSSSLDFHKRIALIFEKVQALVEQTRPNITVIEKIFLGKNADSAFKLGHARGVAMAAAVRHGSEVVEYATRSVKKGITGSGAATKDQVQRVLFASLGICEPSTLDASDALALAYYHARCLELRSILKETN